MWAIYELILSAASGIRQVPAKQIDQKQNPATAGFCGVLEEYYLVG
jgi:hypothetical protein